MIYITLILIFFIFYYIFKDTRNVFDIMHSFLKIIDVYNERIIKIEQELADKNKSMDTQS